MLVSIVSKDKKNVYTTRTGDINIGVSNLVGVKSPEKGALMINGTCFGVFPADVLEDIVVGIHKAVEVVFSDKDRDFGVVKGCSIHKNGNYVVNLFDGSDDEVWLEVHETSDELCEGAWNIINNLNNNCSDEYDYNLLHKRWEFEQKKEKGEEVDDYLEETNLFDFD